MAAVELRITGAEAIALALDPVRMRERLSAALDAVVLDAAGKLSEASPVGKYGHLAGAWLQSRGVEWQGNQLVGFTDPEPVASYAKYPIEGRQPGRRPPISALIPWVEYKLGKTGKEARTVAFLIARKIGEEGNLRYRGHGRDPRAPNFTGRIKRDNEKLWADDIARAVVVGL